MFLVQVHRSGFKTYSYHFVVSLGKIFNGTFPDWCSWQAVLNFSKKKIKILTGQKYLAPPEAGWDNSLPFKLEHPSLSCESSD